jgi:hypothetical protein
MLLTFGRLASPPVNVAKTNRRLACGRQPFKTGAVPGPGKVRDPATGKLKDTDWTSCDEFPFASTTAGGADAIVMGVARRENNTQGGLISAFMQKNEIALKQNGGKFYVCVKVPGDAPVGHC